MLDKYKDSQIVLYNILNNAIANNKLSHAYLFDSNGNSDAMDIAISFAKMIICNDSDVVNKENIIMRIDDGNYLDVKIIQPDGIWLKKEELINLQNDFSKKSIEGKKKIYIIKDAEKMNVQTANSLLKFLEEPVDDIIAILVVNNINLILPTILSRCQVIKLNKKNLSNDTINNFFNLFCNYKCGKISIEEANLIIDNIISFILFLEKNGFNTIIYAKKLWHNIFKDREANIMALELLVCFYEDVLKYKSNINSLFFYSKYDYIIEVADYNSIDNLSNKLEIIINNLNSIRYNLNINLLIDKMIIDMCGDNK